MTFSGLAHRTYSTQQKSSRQGAKIDMIICHHAATTNAEQVISMEVSGSREVSSNYVITNTGEIVGIVEEEMRAWTSGSSTDGGKGAAFDRRAITFECADASNGDPWPISGASQQAIVNLMVDVHQRYGIPLDRDHVVGHRELYTRWGASYPTSCPGGMNVDDLVNRARAAVGQPPVAPIQGGGGGGYSAGDVTVNRSATDIQTFLEQHGFSVGSHGIDGDIGPDTIAAIKAFQRSVGLDDDGIWGPQTDGKAFGGGSSSGQVIAKGVPAPPFPLPTGWYFGPKSGPTESVSGYFPPYGGPNGSDGLRQWQQRMEDRGWEIDPDGFYGPQTAGVAHDFQVEKHLAVDSEIGPETWGAAWTADVTAP